MILSLCIVEALNLHAKNPTDWLCAVYNDRYRTRTRCTLIPYTKDNFRCKNQKTLTLGMIE